MGVVLTQLDDEAFGGMALTVIFVRAILLDDRLRHERDHGALLRMDERSASQLVAIGDRAMTVLHCQTRRTVNLRGGEVSRAIER